MKSAGDPTKRSWIDTALLINAFHTSHLREDANWRIDDTARVLSRSKGSVCQYLSIASWMKTHENQLRGLETMNEAIAWIKDHKRKLILGDF